MKKSRNEQGDIQTIISLAGIVLAVIICVVFFAILDHQLKEFKLGVLRVSAANNEFIVRRVIKQVEMEAETEADIIQIISQAESDGTRYWMLFSEDRVLFEKNDSVSSIVSGMNFDQIRDYHFRSGGHNIGAFIEQISKKESFSVSIIKNIEIGAELISAEYVEVNGISYCIAFSTSQSSIFTQSRFGEIDLLIRLIFITFAAAVLALTAWYVVRRRRFILDRNTLSSELVRVNRILLDESAGSSSTGAQARVRDDTTHLYSPAFFDVILDRIIKRSVTQIGIITIQIDNYYLYQSLHGSTKMHETIIRIADTLERSSEQNDLCFKTRNNEFVILKLQTSENELALHSKKLFASLRRLDPDISLAAGYIYRDNSDAMDIAIRAAQASVKKI
ncbi:MAG: diguanylate cyclase [Clostridiaceae bacterium]|nr:diguanylate cyclase [Clostridiaceae bacterium]